MEIVLIIAIAVVVVGVLALALGRGLTISRDGGRLSFEAKEARRETPSEEKVRVGEGIQLENVKAGNVTGVEGAHKVEKRDVDVLREARISGGSIGDISGVRQSGPSKPGGNPEPPGNAAA